MNYRKNFFAILFLTSLSLLASCGIDPLKIEVSKTSDMLALSECVCTFTFHPVCVVKENLSYENSCHAKCGRDSSVEIKPGRCIHNDTFEVCLDNIETTTEKKAFELIKSGQYKAITKYSACQLATY